MEKIYKKISVGFIDPENFDSVDSLIEELNKYKGNKYHIEKEAYADEVENYTIEIYTNRLETDKEYEKRLKRLNIYREKYKESNLKKANELAKELGYKLVKID